MPTLKELLKCQNCGNILFDHDGDTTTCVICGRDHDENGHLIQHPVGKLQERADGKANRNYGPRLSTKRGVR